MNMKPIVIFALLAMAAGNIGRAEDAKTFKSEEEKNSYAIGFDSGNRMRQSEIEVDLEQYLRGLRDGSGGKSNVLSDEEMRETFGKLREQIMARQQEKQREAGEKNRKEGEEFLAANKSKPGVVALPSGLQYKVVKEGEGASPKPEDTVTVHYRGTLVDGTEFDKSAPDQPANFAANAVIRGWTEALTRMKKGSKWQLFIPSDLAYGPSGRPPKIGPNATLIFEVELVSIQPAPAAASPAPPLTSDIIKVPSLEEMKKGAKIETLKPEDVERLQKEQQEKEKK